MPTPSCCDRLTLRVVLLKVSPLVARLISVPDELSLEELHDVLQLVLGWSGQAFYNFRIHGQEIGRRRHLRTRLLREFQLRRREKFLYTYDFLDLFGNGKQCASGRKPTRVGGPLRLSSIQRCWRCEAMAGIAAGSRASSGCRIGCRA